MLRRLNLQTWFNLKEIYASSTGDEEQDIFTKTFKASFKSEFEADVPLWDSNNDTLPYIEDLWKLIVNRFHDWYGCTQDYDEDAEKQVLGSPTAGYFFLRMFNYLWMTYPRYSVLLDSYTAKKTSLLGQISSTSTGEARFNDTPQNGGDYSDDDHTTNITQTSGTNLTDGATPMLRLKELQDSYMNIMKDWCDEFRRFFIPEENISL